MRAVVMPDYHRLPELRSVDEPDAPAGSLKIAVLMAGLQPTDIMRSQANYKTPEVPYIVGGEGVGVLESGERVYFGHSISSSGALAEFTIVPEEEVWPIPDDMPDDQVIALAIAGTGALIPMEIGRVNAGDRVLVLGATGPVGQIALLLARVLGAGQIVAAARTASGLQRLLDRGLADQIVRLGAGNDVAALKACKGDGYDVVFDTLNGKPAEAALRCLAWGGRMVCVGVRAGLEMVVPLRYLAYKSIHGVGTGLRPVAERKAAFDKLLRLARDHDWRIDTVRFELDDAISAWKSQLGSPGGKIVIGTGVRRDGGWPKC